MIPFVREWLNAWRSSANLAPLPCARSCSCPPLCRGAWGESWASPRPLAVPRPGSRRAEESKRHASRRWPAEKIPGRLFIRRCHGEDQRRNLRARSLAPPSGPRPWRERVPSFLGKCPVFWRHTGAYATPMGRCNSGSQQNKTPWRSIPTARTGKAICAVAPRTALHSALTTATRPTRVNHILQPCGSGSGAKRAWIVRSKWRISVS